jgi:radical SAM protein with 4Fe4S-binding SPASM domain
MFSPLADYLAFQDYLNIFGRAETDFKPSESDLPPKIAIDSVAKTSPFFCPDPLTRLAVHADGGLFPCCSDFGRLAPLGNLKTHTLREVWNSPRALKLASPAGRQSLPCRECLKASGTEEASEDPSIPVAGNPRSRALAEIERNWDGI